MNKMHPGLG